MQSQLVHRGAKALIEGNFEKSIELFEKALSKDSSDIMALVGFAKAHFQQSEKTKITPQLDLLKNCYNFLKTAKVNIPQVNPQQKKLLIQDLNIYDTVSIDALLKINSDYIWTNYLNYDTVISNYEYFLTNYYTETYRNSQNKILTKLDELYFDSLKKENTISAYKFYINKFEGATPKGKSLVLAYKLINGLEYDDACAADGIVKLKTFIEVNKNQNFIEEAAEENIKNLRLANKEIERREFNRALADPNIELLEQFIKDYKHAEQIIKAKDTIEKREYLLAKKNHNEIDFENFLMKYPKSDFKNEIEDSLASMMFRLKIISDSRNDLINFLSKIKSYNKGNIINSILDSTNSKIYNIDYQEAQTTTELSKLIEFYKNYKNSSYPNFSITKDKIFSKWEEAIIKYNTLPEKYDLISFIYEFNNEHSVVYNKVIESTKNRLLKNLDAIKQELVRTLIDQNSEENNIYSKLDYNKKNSLIKLVSNKLSIKNTTTNEKILNNLKSIDVKSSTDLLDYFAAFYENFIINNAFIESSLPNTDQVLQISYQTPNGLNSRLIIWDPSIQSYKEVQDFDTNNTTCKTIKNNYGVVAFSKPYISIAYSNMYTIKFYGFKSTDNYCCPSYEFDLNCSFINNQLEPAAAPILRNTSGNINTSPQLYNYLNVGSNINRDLLTKITPNKNKKLKQKL